MTEDFSETFGYRLAPWGPIEGVVVDDTSLDMRWFVPYKDVAVKPKSNLPITLQESTKEWNHFKRNKQLYKTIISRKELMLWVSHDCTVKEDDDDVDDDDAADVDEVEKLPLGHMR